MLDDLLLDEEPEKKPEDTGDLMEVPEDQQVDVDPVDDPEHTALVDGVADDVSDVEEGEYVDPADFKEDE